MTQITSTNGNNINATTTQTTQSSMFSLPITPLCISGPAKPAIHNTQQTLPILTVKFRPEPERASSCANGVYSEDADRCVYP